MKYSTPQMQNEPHTDPEDKIVFRHANIQKKYWIKYYSALSEIFFWFIKELLYSFNDGGGTVFLLFPHNPSDIYI